MAAARTTADRLTARGTSRVQHPRTTVDTGRRPAIPRSQQGHPSGHGPRRQHGTGSRLVGVRLRPARPGWPSPAVGLIGLVTVLVGIGIIMVLSASMGYSLTKEGTPWATFDRQVVWVVLGIIVSIAVSTIDYRLWRRFDGVLLLLTVGALVAVLSPFGTSKNGSQRWIGTGRLQLQPSEVAKFAIAVWLSSLLATRARKIHQNRLTTRPAIVATTVIVGLIMLQPDMGTAIIVCIVSASILMASGIAWERLARIGLWSVGLAVVAGLVEPYRRDRILSFLHPNGDLANTGFQLGQSLVGLGSGRVFGVGIGAGRAKLGFLPNSSTDFIMAIIGEELGLVGTLTVVCLFVGVAIVGTQIARRAPDDFGYLLAIGLTTWLVGQAAINIGAVIGIMPITGVPLPFISAGGSSFVVVMAAVGVLISIGRRGVSSDRRSDLVSLIDDAPQLASELRAGVTRHPSGRAVRTGTTPPGVQTAGPARPVRPVRPTRPAPVGTASGSRHPRHPPGGSGRR